MTPIIIGIISLFAGVHYYTYAFRFIEKHTCGESVFFVLLGVAGMLVGGLYILGYGTGFLKWYF